MLSPPHNCPLCSNGISGLNTGCSVRAINFAGSSALNLGLGCSGKKQANDAKGKTDSELSHGNLVAAIIHVNVTVSNLFQDPLLDEVAAQVQPSA
jgi:hypothetical protein